ncbi:MAG: VWA domain-containing protein [Hyphomonadaceae bacterium]
MSRAIEDFLRALRAVDIPVSPATAIDAYRTAALTGFEDRALLKDALCATLAKGESEVARFDHAFDLFFSRPAPAAHEHRRTHHEHEEAPRERLGESSLAGMLLDDDAAGLAQRMEEAAQEANVSDIRLATQRGRMVRRLMTAMGADEVASMIARARESGEATGEALAATLEAGLDDLTAEATGYVSRQLALYAPDVGKQSRAAMLAQRTLSAMNLDDADVAEMQAMAAKMAKRLAERYARRRRRYRKGDLNVRRTLRRSMAYDGVPFLPQWNTEKLDRPEIVVLCDVSNSVAPAAKFLLTLLYSLNEAIERMEAYAFSSRLLPVNQILDDYGIDKAILEVLRRVGFQQTNYGQALADFCDHHLHTLNRGTTVIVLGDARSNFIDPRVDLMQTIQKRARAVIWLNPEDESRWGTGDSVMPRYAPFCRAAKTCNSLAQLERVIDGVLRAYSPT